ncbi:MAG: hypothetical protein A2Y82_03160 [Candidatus Buchananbacteria bacterium RBG_13_36_9]|uniref:Uncharacterized protein n=1 Tax=Candidatus Buchananbacteria bacterium RBG_13_36_9 TaxID=1797530 RepID=A0A1G1XR79_9BACT|nr:MAG: hypothetical protein A2Y82_03160 [Candidatus Buchananbacteria bacterium RBG_13_36_9]
MEFHQEYIYLYIAFHGIVLMFWCLASYFSSELKKYSNLKKEEKESRLAAKLLLVAFIIMLIIDVIIFLRN